MPPHKNPITVLTGIDHPFIQVNLVNIRTGQFTSAFSRQLTKEILTRLIQEVQDQF